jgi:hypothetical protein
VHDSLLAGGTVDVAAPRGDFVLTDAPNPLVLLAAGIGVIPVLAMLQSLRRGHEHVFHTRPDAAGTVRRGRPTTGGTGRQPGTHLLRPAERRPRARPLSQRLGSTNTAR